MFLRMFVLCAIKCSVVAYRRPCCRSSRPNRLLLRPPMLRPPRSALRLQLPLTLRFLQAPLLLVSNLLMYLKLSQCQEFNVWHCVSVNYVSNISQNNQLFKSADTRFSNKLSSRAKITINLKNNNNYLL